MRWENIIGIILMFHGLGIVLDKSLNNFQIKKIKSKIGDWWIELSDEQFNRKEIINQSLFYFNILFSTIYGKKHFTLRCFFASMISSIFFSF
jgi:hypothetical protein